MASRNSRSRRRKRRRGDGTIVRIIVPLSLLVVLGLVASFLLRPSAAPTPKAEPTTSACPAVDGVIVDGINVPPGPVAGYCQPALVNAVQIISAGQRLTKSERAEEIGVMTAIGESNLQNLNYGDAAGPDSRGLFQQRSNYGPIAARMNPYTAATAFFTRMLGVTNWNTRPPTEVAHLVQINANPNYYTPYFPRAVVVVETLLSSRVPPALTVASTVTPVGPALPSPNP